MSLPRVAAFPPAFARAVRLRLQSVRLDHSHCIQPAKRTWACSVRNRGFVVMAALAMLCRAGAWWALMRAPRLTPPGRGAPSWDAPRPMPPNSSCTPRRSRSASTPPRRARWSSRVACSSRSPRSSSPPRNARPRRCRRGFAAPETISFTRSPSCIGTDASCMSRWRLRAARSRRARPVSRMNLAESHEAASQELIFGGN